MKSLAKRVEDRYQSAAEMQADIQRYLDGQPVDAPAVRRAPAARRADAEPTSIFRPATDAEEDHEEERGSAGRSCCSARCCWRCWPGRSRSAPRCSTPPRSRSRSRSPRSPT